MATAPATTLPVHQAIAHALIDSGVEVAFGLMGEDTAKLTTYLHEEGGIDYYGARHESMAVAMADGYGRMSGRLGVAILSRGPGLVNGLTAAVAARKRGTRLLVIAGDSPAGEREAGVGERYPKHVRQPSILEACDLLTETITTPESAAPTVATAIRRASEGKVVGLGVPTDLFDAEAPPAPATPTETHAQPTLELGEADLAELARLLDQSSLPVLLAGAGAVRSGAGPAIQALAERVGALTATSLLAKDLFRSGPFDLGIAGGFAGETTRRILTDADLVVAFGASLNAFTSGGGKLLAGAKIVQVDTDPNQIALNMPVELGVAGDARQVAEALGGRCAPAQRLRTDEIREALARQREHPDYEDHSRDHELDPRTVMRAIDRALPADRQVVVDAGAFSGFPSQYVSVPDPRAFAFCLDFSAVGLGHGTGLGAAVAGSDRCTALFIGDGGLLMTLGELETARRSELSLIYVVLDDGAYGAERHYLDLAGLPNSTSLFGMVDFAGIARALGMEAITLATPADLESLDGLAERPRPLLVDCKIDGTIRPLWLEELYGGREYGR
jgi:thiamine pyrophosphate-dependent acetolactate synthase large subunit-like protein